MNNYTTLVYVKARTSNLDNAEFNFDNKYEFHIVNEEKLSCKYFLSVKKIKNPMPYNFWGENISSLNVIAGKNGAGKTSFLKFIMNNIGEDITALYGEEVFYILRYGEKYLYGTTLVERELQINSESEQIDIEDLHQYIVGNNLEKESCFGNSCFWKNYIFYCNCLGNCLNENSSMVIDVSLDYWVNSIVKSKHLGNEEYVIQKELRKELDQKIFRFIYDGEYKRIAEKIGMRLPGLLVFRIEKNYKENQLREKTNKFWKNTWVNVQRCERYVERGFVTRQRELQYESAINYFAVMTVSYLVKEEIFSKDKLEGFINLLADTTEETGVNLAIQLIQSYICEKKDGILQCENLLSILKMISEETKPYVLYWQKDNELVIRLSEENYKTVELLFDKENYFFEFSLEYEGKNGMLSSGEKSRINLLVSLYEGYKQLEKNTGNSSRSVLLIADEIDAYFHPQFQLSVVSDLVGAVNEIFQGYKVQILMTTNTPLEMTDIPNKSITYIENGATIGHPVNEKTFAGNYIALLKNSFFTNSTMGDFSKQKINSVISFLREQETIEDKMRKARCSRKKLEEVKYIISIIGEPILSNKLMQWYNEVFPEESEMND